MSTFALYTLSCLRKYNRSLYENRFNNYKSSTAGIKSSLNARDLQRHESRVAAYRNGINGNHGKSGSCRLSYLLRGLSGRRNSPRVYSLGSYLLDSMRSAHPFTYHLKIAFSRGRLYRGTPPFSRAIEKCFLSLA